MFKEMKAAWNQKLAEWTKRIERAADEREAAKRGEKPEPKVIAANTPATMPNRLLSIEEQRRLGFLSNTTSKYTPSFDERAAEWDKLHATDPPPFEIVQAGFVGGQAGIFSTDPRTGERLAERAIADARRKYGAAAGFSMPTPRL